jgi:protein-S-isoprenylcysteine O-methyltransferase Ste14
MGAYDVSERGHIVTPPALAHNPAQDAPTTSMDTARYIVGVLVVTFLPPGLLWWFLIHPFVAFWRKVGPTVTLSAMGLLGVVGVVGLMQIRHTLVGTDLGAHPASLTLAAALLLVQVVLALKRRPHLTARILVGLPELTADDDPGVLLTDGIYGQMRHPRYVEVAAGTLAMALFSGYSGALLMGVATLPILHAIVLLEERELRQRFGLEYEEYCTRVPRYLPLTGSRRGPGRRR